jgi:hypothetical protein
VNGMRVEGKALSDGDEILVGRYRLKFFSVPAASEVTLESRDASSLHGTS